MARLRASMFLSVGAILCVAGLIFSRLIGLAVIGGVFILIGLVKAAFSYIQTSTRTTHNTQAATPQQQETTSKRCFVCSAKNSSQANFCGHCGHKLS